MAVRRHLIFSSEVEFYLSIASTDGVEQLWRHPDDHRLLRLRVERVPWFGESLQGQCSAAW